MLVKHANTMHAGSQLELVENTCISCLAPPAIKHKRNNVLNFHVT